MTHACSVGIQWHKQSRSHPTRPINPTFWKESYIVLYFDLLSYKSYILTFWQFKFDAKHDLTWVEATHNFAICTVKDVINKYKEMEQEVTEDWFIGFMAPMQLTLNICQQSTLQEEATAAEEEMQESLKWAKETEFMQQKQTDCCCCRDEPVRHCLYGGTRMSRRDEEFHQTLDPKGSVPCGSWQLFYWLGHHSRVAVIAGGRSSRIVHVVKRSDHDEHCWWWCWRLSTHCQAAVGSPTP